MTFRMSLYDGSPFRVLGMSDELVALRDGTEAQLAPSSASAAPWSAWFDVTTLEPLPRTFRCHVALAAACADLESDTGTGSEHPGIVTHSAPPEPDEPSGPGAVLFTEDALLPAPDAPPHPRELFGPCLLLVPVGRQRRGLYGAYLMLGAPDGTRDLVSAGQLPEPKSFRYAAFLGAEHRFATASAVPFTVRAGLVTAIVDRSSGAPLERPDLL